MKILNLSLFIVLADQVTKLAIKGITIPVLGIQVHGLPLGSSHPIIGDFLRITYIENPGMAFGIDIGGKLFFSLFSIVASIGILLYLYKARNENFLFRVSLALILGGAVGNLIDRVFYGVLFNDGGLFYGKVVDFIDADFFNVNLFGYHLTRWPVFNIADAAVTCGVILMLFAHRRKSEEESPVQINEPGSTDMLGSSVFSPDSSPSPSGPEPPQS